MSSEENRPHSRLPADAAYWDDLAARSVHAAFDAGATQSAPWWRPFGDSAFVLAASALLVLLGGALLVGDRPARGSAEPAAIAWALAPRDPLLSALLVTTTAPESAALLGLVALREEER